MTPGRRRRHGARALDRFPDVAECIKLPDMTRDIITQILENEGAKAGAGGFSIREDREAACFVSAPGDLLQIPRVVKIDLKEKFLSLQPTRTNGSCSPTRTCWASR